MRTMTVNEGVNGKHQQSLRNHARIPLVRDTLGSDTRAVVWIQGVMHRFRGSANQRIIRLTDAIPAERINSGGKAQVDITIDSNNRLVIVGIPPRGFMKHFETK